MSGYRENNVVTDIDGVVPTLCGRDYKGPKNIKVKQIGTRTNYGGVPRTQDRVYDPNGISPALNQNGGGSCEVKIAIPVLTPDREEKRQNGRRFKEDGDEMFTLTAQDRHGVAVGSIYSNVQDDYQRGVLPNCVRALKASKHDVRIVMRVKEATKQGYTEASEGDSINISMPNSKTRRGRVGKGLAQTLETQCTQVVIDNFRIRKLTPREYFRLQGFPDSVFDKAASVNSKTQLYKQAGNSVTVPVVCEIAQAISKLEGGTA